MPTYKEKETDKWFALQVRTRWESSTESLLSGKGFETFLPKYNNRVRRNGRMKDVEAPLFPGYVFCRFDAQDRLPILITPGVISVVSRGRLPIPLEDSELAAVQTIVHSKLPVQVSVSLLRRSVSLEIDRARVMPLNPSRSTTLGFLHAPALLSPGLK